MSVRVKALIPLVVGLVTAPAHAQLLPTWETHITLTQQDLDMIREAVTNQVHGKAAGTTATWSGFRKRGVHQAARETPPR
jgi:hypothetical protein